MTVIDYLTRTVGFSVAHHIHATVWQIIIRSHKIISKKINVCFLMMQVFIFIYIHENCRFLFAMAALVSTVLVFTYEVKLTDHCANTGPVHVYKGAISQMQASRPSTHCAHAPRLLRLHKRSYHKARKAVPHLVLEVYHEIVGKTFRWNYLLCK